MMLQINWMLILIGATAAVVLLFRVFGALLEVLYASGARVSEVEVIVARRPS